jgi:hypothetical protein
LDGVKQKFVDVLKADAALGTLLGYDAAGNVPVYLHWPMGKMMFLPEITVTDVVDQGEVSGLNDAYDGTKRYEWSEAQVQVDVWAKSEGSRGLITAQVRKVLLNALADFRSIGVSLGAPLVTSLNETKRLIFRHSLRYPVFYVLEVS